MANERLKQFLAAGLCLLVFSLSAHSEDKQLFLFSESSHKDMEELLIQHMSIEEELDVFSEAVDPDPAMKEAFRDYLENRNARKAVLDRQAGELFGNRSQNESAIAFFSYDPDSAFGRKLQVYHRTNLILLKDLLQENEFLRYRQELRERKRRVKVEKALGMLKELELELSPDKTEETVEVLSGLPSFLPRTNPESMVTGFSQAYLVDREIRRLESEKAYIRKRLEPAIGFEAASRIVHWYEDKIDILRASESLMELEDGMKLTILLPEATRPVKIQAGSRKRLFLDCMQKGVALVPMERINFLSRSVLRSYGASSRGDAGRLMSFLQGRDLLVENYRVELDYLRSGIVYLTREIPWGTDDLIRSDQVIRMTKGLDKEALEFYALVRDGSEEQFRSVEMFLKQMGFTVTRLDLGIEEAIPVFLPGLAGAADVLGR